MKIDLRHEEALDGLVILATPADLELDVLLPARAEFLDLRSAKSAEHAMDEIHAVAESSVKTLAVVRWPLQFTGFGFQEALRVANLVYFWQIGEQKLALVKCRYGANQQVLERTVTWS